MLIVNEVNIQTASFHLCSSLQCGGLARDVAQPSLLPHPAILPARLCLNRSVNTWRQKNDTLGEKRLSSFLEGITGMSLFSAWFSCSLQIFLWLLHVGCMTSPTSTCVQI